MSLYWAVGPSKRDHFNGVSLTQLVLEKWNNQIAIQQVKSIKTTFLLELKLLDIFVNALNSSKY